jgi:hypothetical protein
MNESNNDRYVIACIRIPMKIFENGKKYEMQKNLANIQFEDCNELPEKGNLEECNLSSIFEKFYVSVSEINEPTTNQTVNDISNNENNDNTLHEPAIEIPKMYVLKAEILNKNHKHIKNNTFKHKLKDINRFSRKTRE